MFDGHGQAITDWSRRNVRLINTAFTVGLSFPNCPITLMGINDLEIESDDAYS